MRSRYSGRPPRRRSAGRLDQLGIVASVSVITGLAVVALLPSAPTAPAGCWIRSLGRGDCAGSPEPATGRARPCADADPGPAGPGRAGVAVIAPGTDRWLVAELADGRYRLTRDRGPGGPEVEQVYHADSRPAAEEFLGRLGRDRRLDATVGASGPARWLADRFRTAGPFPEPDETWVPEGMLEDADTTLGWIAVGDERDLDSTTLLGNRLHRDGSGTAVYSVAMPGAVASSIWATGDEAAAAAGAGSTPARDGTTPAGLEVDYDQAGNATTLRIRATRAAATDRAAATPDGPGADSYVDRVVELPIRAGTDRRHAAGMAATVGAAYVPGLNLGLPGVDSAGPALDVAAFLQDARDHGRLSEAEYDLSPKTGSGRDPGATFVARATGMDPAPAGPAPAVTTIARRYFDGTSWRPQEACPAGAPGAAAG